MDFTEKELDQIKKISEIYIQAKSFMLYAEEIDPDASANIQVFKELRDAFDHLALVLYHKSCKTDEDVEYSTINISKALGHVYRATFDALDGAVLSLRLLIQNELEAYEPDILKEVLGDYWEIKETINSIVENVAVYRGQKDSGKKGIGKVLNDYIKDVDKIQKIYKRILANGENFDECLKKNKKKSRKKVIATIVIGVFISVATFYLTKILYITDKNPQEITTPIKDNKQIIKSDTTVK